MHKKEIFAIRSKIEGARMTIVPISLYTTKNNLIKVELALAKGKTKFDKRASIRKKDLDREAEIALHT